MFKIRNTFFSNNPGRNTLAVNKASVTFCLIRPVESSNAFDLPFVTSKNSNYKWQYFDSVIYVHISYIYFYMIYGFSKIPIISKIPTREEKLKSSHKVILPKNS